jgi:adhesin/invasin
LVTIVAFTTGSESFTDLNGNGYYDEGEPFDDLPEPFIDGNDSHEFENGELYIDVNSNGQFDSGNQLFDGTGGKSPNTTIWLAGRVLFSAATAPLQVTSDGDIPFNIPNGGSQTFTVNTFSDTYGNALVAGTTFKVTTNNGMLGGTTDFTFNDNSGRGLQSFSFTLSSIPYTVITTGTDTVIFDYPFPSAATITITISSPIQDKAPGGNGDQTVIISGTINVE